VFDTARLVASLRGIAALGYEHRTTLASSVVA